MTLFSYEIFDAVARQGSFNKAAQQLHLTPSAISHAIAVMEEELGFALFNRGKNGVSMTSYGASLYPSIRDGAQPFLDIIVGALIYFDLDLRIMGRKAFEQPRQQRGTYRVEHAQLHLALFQTVQAGDALLQRLVTVEHIARRLWA